MIFGFDEIRTKPAPETGHVDHDPVRSSNPVVHGLVVDVGPATAGLPAPIYGCLGMSSADVASTLELTSTTTSVSMGVRAHKIGRTP
jgi:hypothetical protein